MHYFTVLGEAMGRFALKNQSSEIEWHKPISLRNRIVHGYWSADLGILVDAAQQSRPSTTHPTARSACRTHRHHPQLTVISSVC